MHVREEADSAARAGRCAVEVTYTALEMTTTENGGGGGCLSHTLLYMRGRNSSASSGIRRQEADFPSMPYPQSCCKKKWFAGI